MEHVLVGTLACAFVLKIGAFVHVDQVEGACHGHLSMPMEWNGIRGESMISGFLSTSLHSISSFKL